MNKFIAFGIWILGGIGGIVLGNKIQMIDPAFKYIVSYTFNWVLMLYVWIGSFIGGAFFLSLHTIIELLRSINLNLSNE